MAISVRLEPELEAMLVAEARRRGSTKDESVDGVLDRLQAGDEAIVPPPS